MLSMQRGLAIHEGAILGLGGYKSLEHIAQF